MRRQILSLWACLLLMVFSTGWLIWEYHKLVKHAPPLWCVPHVWAQPGNREACIVWHLDRACNLGHEDSCAAASPYRIKTPNFMEIH